MKIFVKSRTISLAIGLVLISLTLPGTVSALTTTSLNAQVISTTIPSSMNAGQSYAVSVTMKNTGRTTWNSGSTIHLGGIDNDTGVAAQFGPYRIDIPAGINVRPNSPCKFTFTMTAPGTPGYYSPKYEMISDGYGWFGAKATKTIRVLSNAASVPSAKFVANVTSGQAPLAVQFTDQSTGTAPLSYAWDFDNNGINDSTSKNPAFTYSTAGTYRAKLTVSNSAGSNSITKTITVTATSVIPTAGFSTDVTGGTAPLAVQFTDQSTGTAPMSYAWDFDNNGINDSTVPNPQFIYSTFGTYTVKLTVTNSAGTDSVTRTNYITVSSPPIVGNGEFGSEVNPTGNPIGGGAGYSGIISETEAGVKYVVITKAELLTALKSAKAGEVVFVQGSAVINMTGTPSVTIPAGVTLASDRGLAGSSGALIKRIKNLNGSWEEPMFIVGGDNVRITGLQLEGEMYPQDYGNGEVYPGSVNERYYLVGLFANGVKNFEADNNEMRGWAWSSVSLRQCDAAYIHHNYIHHNQARGEGYGVNLYGGNALIEANLFDYNRHDVTGAGMSGEQYEARYNHVLGNGNAIGAVHFDVHKDEETGTGAAGAKFLIHHNTIDKGIVATVHIRARPTIGCYVYNNIINARATDTGVPGGLPIFETNSNQNLFCTNNYWMGTLYPTNSGIVWYQ
jgi:PKD repeat protein